MIIGIFLLGFEVRQAYQATELQAAQSYVSMAHELDFQMAADPFSWTINFTAPEDLSPEERWRQSRWFFGLLRTWENGHYLYRTGVLDESLWAGQEALMTGAMRARGIPLHHYVESNRNLLSEDFMAYLDSLRESEVE